MKKKNKQKTKGFDEAFDAGKATINFKEGIATEGLSNVVKIPPLNIPLWLAKEIEEISKVQANSKASVIRQLLVEAIQAKRKVA